jgi:CheY-like chemotaxis protein
LARQLLLLVDADAESRRLTEVSLKKAGFSVTVAANGRDALEKCEISPPDLVVSETRMPELDGFELCRRLREDERTRAIPFVFLTGQKTVEDKVRGLELGVEDYLTKPIYVKEMVTRLRMLLQRRERERLERREGRAGFSGSLAEIGIVDLVQTLEMGRKTGALRIAGPAGRQATVWFSDGQVVDCESGSLAGEAAFYRLLDWGEGDFVVEFGSDDREARIRMATRSLLLEGMRRLDELGRLTEQMPPPSAVLEVDGEALARRLGELPDDLNPVLRLFDGRRTLEEAVDASGRDDLGAAAVVSRLYFEGILREAPDAGPTAIALPEGREDGPPAPPAPSPPGSPTADAGTAEPREVGPAAAPEGASRGAPAAGPQEAAVAAHAGPQDASVAGPAGPGHAPSAVAPGVAEPALAPPSATTGPSPGPTPEPGGVDWFAGPTDGRARAAAAARPAEPRPPRPPPQAPARTAPRRPAPPARSRTGTALLVLSTVAALALAAGIAARRRAAVEPEPAPGPAAEVAAPERAAVEPEPAPGPAADAAPDRTDAGRTAPADPGEGGTGAASAVAAEATADEGGGGAPGDASAAAPRAAPRDAYLEAMEAGARRYRAQAFAAAAAEYRRASRIRETGDALAALGRALYDAGRTAEAGVELRRAVRVDPGSAAAWLALGEVHLARGEAAEARAAYERYLEIEPRGRWARDVRQVLGRLDAR